MITKRIPVVSNRDLARQAFAQSRYVPGHASMHLSNPKGLTMTDGARPSDPTVRIPVIAK